MIKANDVVKVNDWGCEYSTYSEWFVEHAESLKTEWIACYAYGDNSKFKDYKVGADNNNYIVLYTDGEKALITNESHYKIFGGVSSSVYLISLCALKKVETKKEEPKGNSTLTADDKEAIIRTILDFIFSE